MTHDTLRKLVFKLDGSLTGVRLGKGPKKPPSWIEEWVAYFGLRLIGTAMASFDSSTMLRMSGRIGRRCFRMDKRRSRRALWQLRIAYPDMPESERRVLAEQSYESLFKLAAETLVTPRMIRRDNWLGQIDVGNGVGEAIRLLNQGKPTIMLTGHLGNWEALGSVLSLIGYRFAALARPLPHKRVNDYLLGIRESRGMRIITKFNATDTMQEVLNEGGTLGFIADQNAGKRGLFVPFFGRLASAYKSVGLLAMQYDAPIICGGSPRAVDDQGRARFRLEVADIIYPSDWERQPDPLYYITARYTRALESLVRRFPDQYLWSHRRWKSRPRHELQGKPLPASLERKLEELPWMTDGILRSAAKPVDYSAVSDGVI